VRRVSVRGTSGSGKSTFGRALARRLGLTYIELDNLHHGPNWNEATAEELQALVREAMDGAPDGWVIDGNYDSKLGDLVVDEADTIVWLDLPLSVKVPRVLRRTMHRIWKDVELWNGNRERWQDLFAGRNSVFYWAFRNHARHRQEWPRRFQGDTRLVRLRSQGEATRWLETVTEE
jgi:adenylate kinase family enzyme